MTTLLTNNIDNISDNRSERCLSDSDTIREQTLSEDTIDIMKDSAIIKQSLPSEPNYLLCVLGIIALVALISLVYFLIKRKKLLRLLPH